MEFYKRLGPEKLDLLGLHVPNCLKETRPKLVIFCKIDFERNKYSKTMTKYKEEKQLRHLRCKCKMLPFHWGNTSIHAFCDFEMIEHSKCSP